MPGIQKFKSFREAEAAGLSETCMKPFDQAKTAGFLEEMSGFIGVPYKPGVYRFHSFEDAFVFDLERYIKQAARACKS